VCIRMKLCWDNIENIRLNKNGNFRDIVKKKTYHLEACKMCGREYLLERRNSKFRCQSCCQLGSNNPMYGKFGELNHFYGKHHTEETKKNWSKQRRGKNTGNSNPFYGKHHTEETKKKLRLLKIGKKRTEESIRKQAETSKARGSHVGPKNPMYGRKSDNHPNWDGGYNSNNIPKYDTYAHQIDWCEEVRRNADDPNILEVRCTHCDKWFIPTLTNVVNRVMLIKNGPSKNLKGEQRFYCSDHCKKACPLYGKSPEQLMKEDAVRAGRLKWLELDREVQHELREMVLERDNHTCRKCGAVDKPLHCHHIEPVAINPIESADMDNCITLCVDCHKEAHQKDGCKYGQLRMEVC
jgi:hypothetical protein